VPDGQGLADATQDDLLVSDQASDPQPVHPDAVDIGSAGTVEATRGGVRCRAESGFVPGRRDQLRRTT
jgi:hypothetical protein